MRLRAAILAALLVSLAPLVAAAGPSLVEAEPIGPGQYSGSLPKGAAHWFKVDVPAGTAIFVAYEVLAGSASNRFRFTDEQGIELVYLDGDRERAWIPNRPTVWIWIEAHWTDNRYQFEMTFDSPPAQNDAGSGGDASNSQAGALPIGEGSISGKIQSGFGDIYDWYRIDAPAGMIVDLRSNEFAALVDAQGGSMGSVPRSGTASLLGGSPIYVLYSWSGSYVLDVAYSPAPDARMSDMVIQEVPFRVGEESTELSMIRDVQVRISNVGLGATRSATYRIFTESPSGTAPRVLVENGIVLQPGEERTIKVRWDTTGQLGQVTLVAEVMNAFEFVPADNAVTVQTAVGVEGQGAGVDLLNAAAGPVRLEYGGARAGAGSGPAFVGSEGGTVRAG